MAKSKIEREKKVVKLMIRIYCRKNHKERAKLCGECENLLNYAKQRLDACKYGENKTYCGKCPTRCYKKEHADQIRQVMQFSGKRMIFYHPVEAMRYIFSKMKKPT